MPSPTDTLIQDLTAALGEALPYVQDVHATHPILRNQIEASMLASRINLLLVRANRRQTAPRQLESVED